MVLRLLLDTGVRVSELCGLALTDVDLDRELAYVTGKGSRPGVVPFGAKTAQAVDRYLRVRALHPHARSPLLLLGQRGPMTPDVLHTRAAQAGVTDVHPHTHLRDVALSVAPTPRVPATLIEGLTCPA
ncbi:tyrosine-type recombinase/integrase [Geodermatophilus sabuli]|uniref:Integrase/recombinase XerD n=1 Tax=Geodermatophilus sabuli TaxID=1564158 RepID=A0A285EDE1_9ACTN|nr:tyrosine-type recombinase/integrase [Geodermatophilus sabuli]MBB3085505.1 site-specific recombinase XerD [Geodermatophilus sabuli]SNX96071.1 integrase/recombinase XerD [Geodermatophilus sabuli]